MLRKTLLTVASVALIFTIYSLVELHRVSTNQAESDDKHFFATEFKSFKTAGSVVQRAIWRSSKSLGAATGSSDDELAEELPGPDIERLEQCVIYRNTELCKCDDRDTIHGVHGAAWGVSLKTELLSSEYCATM